LEMMIRPPTQTIYSAIAETIRSLRIRSVGFESSALTVADFESLREEAESVDWKAGKDRVEKLRAVKDAAEVGQIREAIDIAQRAFAMFRAMLRPSDTEKELTDAMEAYVRRAGGTGTSFTPIVAVGARAALPHAPPSNAAVADSGLLLVDWGATGRLYK